MKVAILLTYWLIQIATIKTASSSPVPYVLTADDLASLSQDDLEYLREATIRAKRSGEIYSAFKSKLGEGIKSKIGMLASGSAAASSYIFGGSSGSGKHGYGYGHGYAYKPHYPSHPPESYDHKSFDFWTLKKSILYTLLQAAKAIKGGVIALKGQLIKGSGYLLQAKGKLLASKGDAVTNMGKGIATSAMLAHFPGVYSASSHHHDPHDYPHHDPHEYPHHDPHDYPHHEESTGHGPEYGAHLHEYGPPSSHGGDYAIPSGPSPQYGLPGHYSHTSNVYLPPKHSSPYEALRGKIPEGTHAGIVILKKIPKGRDVAHGHAADPVALPDYSHFSEHSSSAEVAPFKPVPSVASIIAASSLPSSAPYALSNPPPVHEEHNDPLPSYKPPNLFSETPKPPATSYGTPFQDNSQNFEPSKDFIQSPVLSSNLNLLPDGSFPPITSSISSYPSIHVDNQPFVPFGDTLPTKNDNLPTIESFGPYPGQTYNVQNFENYFKSNSKLPTPFEINGSGIKNSYGNPVGTSYFNNPPELLSPAASSTHVRKIPRRHRRQPQRRPYTISYTLGPNGRPVRI